MKKEKKWQKAIDLYNSLGIPPEYFNPTKITIGKMGYHWILSDRSRGKTTNLLIFGLCVYWCYGIRIEYIRQTEKMTTPSGLLSLFDVIILYHYIDKITDGKFNSVKYDKSYWWLCKIDDTGKIIEYHENPFMHKCNVQENKNLKSNYNSPVSDFIIYDEVIAADGNTLVNEYVKFIDLLLTLNRMRTTTEVFMLSNTITSNSIYFQEMLISDVVKKLKQGESAEFYNNLGTFITIDILSKSKSQTRKKAVDGYYLSNNTEIAGLVGLDAWSCKTFPHIPSGKPEILKVFYIQTTYKKYRIDLVNNDNYGLCCYVHDTTKFDETTDILFTLENCVNKNQIFGTGNSNKNIWKLRKLNRWFYANNEIGADIVYYLKNYKNMVATMEV